VQEATAKTAESVKSDKQILQVLQSVIALLSFACDVVSPVRASLRRLIDATMDIKKQDRKKVYSL
jgi:hypothetical protein